MQLAAACSRTALAQHLSARPPQWWGAVNTCAHLGSRCPCKQPAHSQRGLRKDQEVTRMEALTLGDLPGHEEAHEEVGSSCSGT